MDVRSSALLILKADIKPGITPGTQTDGETEGGSSDNRNCPLPPLEQDCLHILRHGVKHHLYNRFCRGVESGDDWTLDRIHKGYHAEDILEQCHKLEKAGIDYWMTFLNGVAGREHSREHAIQSAKIFSQCKPMLVGTGGLTLFPGTPLLEEA